MHRPTIFDIPRKPRELKSANEGTANAQYRQVSATKDVTGTQFSQGVQQFRFDTSGNTWFVPSMCYFRMRCSLTQVRADGEQPTPILSKADVAPNVGLAANLFKSAEVQLNGNTLERIAERLPQIDALKTRMSNTGSWLDQVGKSTNFWNADFAARRETVAVDGYTGVNPILTPEYGPILTQEQAGFAVNHLIRYNTGSQMLIFDDNGVGALDILNGAMAVRPGDRFILGRNVLEVKNVVDATHAMVDVVATGVAGRGSLDDGGNPPGGVHGWSVQKLHHARDNQARGKNQFEIVWRPPLGFFNVEHAIPPGGQWMVEFNPANAMDCRKNVVESLLGDLDVLRNPSVANQIDFRVEEFFFYVYTVESDRFDHGDWLLDIQHTRCQLQNMPSDATSLIQKTFDVPGKTSHLTLAFQDQAEGSDTRCSRSRFKIRPPPVGDPTNQAHEGQDLLLERFFMTYAGQQKPAPDFDGRYENVTGNSRVSQSNFLVHRYVDSLMQADLYHSDGGAESFNDWVRRGPYYHFRWPKDAMENSTRVNVNVKFARPFAQNMQHQIMLFSQWRTAYKISHKDGRIQMQKLLEL